ncbi:hypothetical protein HDU79_003151 [Rhizoclosmatium sp. JEL0117]|nr:hypothetical protein HDU79_003151 [Rhizoclosmatium sp. JEL0117]
MSWMHPKIVWKLRALSRSFQRLLSTPDFAALNITRFVPAANKGRTEALDDPDEWDLLFGCDAPTVYASEYARQYLTQLTAIDWRYSYSNFKIEVPSPWFPHLENLTCFAIMGGSGNSPWFLPEEVTLLPNLQILSIMYSDLSGSIPASIGCLTFLCALELVDNNLLKGCLPTELGKLLRLERLEASGMGLEGPIPPEFGNLCGLQELILGFHTKKSGQQWTIPPELGQLSNLRILALENCNLMGTIPRELGQLHRLEVLNLADNHLTGEIPVEVTMLRLESFIIQEKGRVLPTP